MPVNIKSPQVDELLGQLKRLTGRGATEIVRDALDQELQRQRRIRRSEQLQQHLGRLQERAATQARPFDPAELYDTEGLPG